MILFISDCKKCTHYLKDRDYCEVFSINREKGDWKEVKNSSTGAKVDLTKEPCWRFRRKDAKNN